MTSPLFGDFLFSKKVLQFKLCCGRIQTFGGIAQLGERLNGIQEVSGSIPLISTKKDLMQIASGLFNFYLPLKYINSWHLIIPL